MFFSSKPQFKFDFPLLKCGAGRFAIVATVAMVATFTFSGAACAQQGYTTHRTQLRAGPDRGYPLVAYLPVGAPVYVNGCVRNYHWCDVTAGGNRGWVTTRHLNYPYQNRNVLIWGNGALLALPIIGYSVGSYWDNHYRGQRWYVERARWSNWQPGQRAPQFAPAARPAYVQPHSQTYPQHRYPRAPAHAEHQPRGPRHAETRAHDRNMGQAHVRP